MRARLILLVVAILVVAMFVTLNLSEFTRTSTLSFGLFVAEASVGMVMLTFLLIGLVAFVLTGAMHRTQTLIESRQYLKDIQHHRELSDKAEASRFTELRTHLDEQLRGLRQRDEIAATELEKAMVNSQRELRTQLEQMNRMLVTRIAEMENRLDSRSGGRGFGPVPVTTATAADIAAHDVQLRDQQRLDDERLRDTRQVHADQRAVDAEIRTEERVAAEARRPDATGWRRWF